MFYYFILWVKRTNKKSKIYLKHTIAKYTRLDEVESAQHLNFLNSVHDIYWKKKQNVILKFDIYFEQKKNWLQCTQKIDFRIISGYYYTTMVFYWWKFIYFHRRKRGKCANLQQRLTVTCPLPPAPQEACKSLLLSRVRPFYSTHLWL